MTAARSAGVHDLVALAEIELCGELIIAASSASEERLSSDRIDEVLKVDRSGSSGQEREGLVPAQRS